MPETSGQAKAVAQPKGGCKTKIKSKAKTRGLCITDQQTSTNQESQLLQQDDLFGSKPRGMADDLGLEEGTATENIFGSDDDDEEGVKTSLHAGVTTSGGGGGESGQ